MNWMEDNDEDKILKAIADLRDRTTRQFMVTIIVIVVWSVLILLALSK